MKRWLGALLIVVGLLVGYVSARTEVPITFLEKGNRYAGCHGTVELSLTASAATTEAVYCGGLPLGRIYNESGGSLTISIYDASTVDGTACTIYDEDGVAVGPLTIANNSSYQLPSGCSGMTWCLLVLSTGTADVTVSFGR